MPHHINDTIKTFGYPETLVADLGQWVVLLRLRQPTLGSLVLAAADPATAVSGLEPETQAALGAAIAKVDRVLRTEMRCDKVNFLMLMMVDPHVHFHVIPRYAATVAFGGASYSDSAWPKAPNLADALAVPPGDFKSLQGRLKSAFART
jgi:diadenosine tetraphosphate (Ap4A) HIT family hydrolase